MQKLVAFLAATAALVLASSICVAHATPLPGATPPREFSPIERIGCARAGDNCPYGYRIERHGGRGWSCEPCDNQKHGYYQRDYQEDGDQDYPPRRYQQYGYEPWRYRQYDDGAYDGPRRYQDY